MAIIDLSDAGRQPMTGRTADTAVIFNGEIYNFQQRSAECDGYPFRSRTDTEVILALYERYGEDFVERLDGMFAIALWDGARRQLLLARDRAGKKPLYYYEGEGFFAFASEIKALLAVDWVSYEIDPAALPLYLTFGYVPTPGTFYTRIRKVEPATLVALDAHGSSRSRSYWSYPVAPAAPQEPPAGTTSEAEHGSQLRDLVTRAVAKRMVADVPLGAFLSGGIDSSVVVGTMSRLSREPVRTFSIGFEDDPTYDETSYARMVAERFGTQHTEFRVRPDAIDLVEKLVWHYDEPFGDSSAIPTWIVSKLTRGHVKVALSGDGGDELFAGYERFAATLWTERLPKAALGAGRVVARLLPAPAHAKNRRRRIKRFFERAGLPLLDRYLAWNSFYTRDELRHMVRDLAPSDVAASFRPFLDSERGTLLQRVLHLNFRTYLLDDLLVKTDRMSIAHGLEIRCPILDTALVEWAALLPDANKIRGGTLKYVLKRAYRDLLPQAVLKRGKMGFGVPLGHWLRHDLRDYARDLLAGPGTLLCDLLDRRAVTELLDEHRDCVADHGNKIWALLALEVWLRSVGLRAPAPAPAPCEEQPLLSSGAR